MIGWILILAIVLWLDYVIWVQFLCHLYPSLEVLEAFVISLEHGFWWMITALDWFVVLFPACFTTF